MKLYLGKKAISPGIVLPGEVVKNQNKTITENGLYSYDAGYTGLGNVTVNVPQITSGIAISNKKDGIITRRAIQFVGQKMEITKEKLQNYQFTFFVYAKVKTPDLPPAILEPQSSIKIPNARIIANFGGLIFQIYYATDGRYLWGPMFAVQVKDITGGYINMTSPINTDHFLKSNHEYTFEVYRSGNDGIHGTVYDVTDGTHFSINKLSETDLINFYTNIVLQDYILGAANMNGTWDYPLLGTIISANIQMGDYEHTDRWNF